ncbi:T6 antigen [Slackia heliotrinireducens]|uniref:Cna protein B-type domain-containing protein n=1 Tax=Slackia heliotrinireducens (strain ATCC 29202 / DSM 20476 / NCTC 11029 / RHS 1) TaxID=471855 RepID=C7N3N5_SLAHD|nr:isopeptide-forming domain-containing fimbrial protein [Slackia heliotrinireducens]ACV21626.1 Cna protein B-type domain-containing protein [Slackia heliotrinireducens DSM 20476]VEG99194.1 T6 antigen [Slackia heliotrinireducens]
MTKWKSKLAGVLAAGALAVALVPAAAFGAGALTADTTISVTGIEDNPAAKVTAYKVIEVDQSNTKTDGTAGWRLVTGFDNLEGITLEGLIGTGQTISATEAATLANAASGEGITLSKDGETTTYKATGVEPGVYVVKVTGTGATVYNPMIVSADYSQDDPNTNTVADDAKYTGSTAVAKSSTPPVTKKTVDAKDQTFQIGDTIGFEVTTTVPYYPAPYYTADKTHFEVKDTIDADLSFDADSVKVLDGTTELTKTEDYTVSVKGQTMTIAFTADYLQRASRETTGPADVKITYDAKVVNDAAKFAENVNERTNDVHVEYSNSPTSDGESDHVKTHHYTFGLDADLAGSASGSSKELRKVSVDAAGNAMYEVVNQSDWSKNTPLEGAVFTLTGKSTDGIEYEKEFTTDSDGHISFTGLDAGVEYTLKETSAPAGYQLDKTEHKVKITATYVEGSDVLKSYVVTVDGTAIANVTVTNDANEEITSTTYTDNDQTFQFKNVKAGVLPSTGGNGIYFYVIFGAAVAVVSFVGMRVYKKRAAATK